MIRKLREKDLAAYREIRMAGLMEKPHYFGASIRDEKRNTDKVYLDGFGIGNPIFFVLGKFIGRQLAGVIGFRRFTLENLRHKASLWGMYVAPEYRNRGLGSELLAAWLERAGKLRGLESVQLAVESGNRPARKLYANFGFERFALERRGLKIGNRYYDEVWMRMDLAKPGKSGK